MVIRRKISNIAAVLLCASLFLTACGTSEVSDSDSPSPSSAETPIPTLIKSPKEGPADVTEMGGYGVDTQIEGTIKDTMFNGQVWVMVVSTLQGDFQVSLGIAYELDQELVRQKLIKGASVVLTGQADEPYSSEDNPNFSFDTLNVGGKTYDNLGFLQPDYKQVYADEALMQQIRDKNSQIFQASEADTKAQALLGASPSMTKDEIIAILGNPVEDNGDTYLFDTSFCGFSTKTVVYASDTDRNKVDLVEMTFVEDGKSGLELWKAYYALNNVVFTNTFLDVTMGRVKAVTDDMSWTRDDLVLVPIYTPTLKTAAMIVEGNEALLLSFDGKATNTEKPTITVMVGPVGLPDSAQN